MSLESQLERLNANIEALVGAIAANTSVAASITNNAAPAAAAEKPTRTRRTKEQIAADEGKGAAPAETPAAETPAAPAEAPQAAETPQAADDPFGDLNAGETTAPTYTVDDVREVALKLRDATSMDKAKAFIANFGVDSIKYLPEDKFADFITKANAAIAAAKDL